MSNYFSMKSLIDAGTSNMTVIRNNVKTDSGIDTLSMPSWFKFNNTSYANCYVSGNSWLGFESQSSEAIRINRRDAASWYVWQESGVVCLEQFVKIRWRGYSYYNTTSESALLEYDVIFLESGGIYIHIVNYPTSYTDGSKQIIADTTYNFDLSQDIHDISFYYNNETNSFNMAYEMYDISFPYKLLISSDGLLYTIVDDKLSQLSETTLTADLFDLYGVYTINSNLLSSLNNVNILACSDISGLNINSKLSGVQKNNIIIKNISLHGPNSDGVKNISYIGSDDIIISFSVDGINYKKYDLSWVDVSGDIDGMLLSDVTNISEDIWGILCSGFSELFIKIIFTNTTQYLTSLSINI